MRLSDLNTLSREGAEREFLRCCGSTRWAAAIVARRPFKDGDEVARVGEEIWWTLEGGDWLEAFAQHPRIGARGTVGWASDEQAGVRTADANLLARLADLNHDYERKFGHVFLICASGRTADEMLRDLEARLGNDPATELKIAATEQSKITRLRLQKLLEPPPGSAESTKASSTRK